MPIVYCINDIKHWLSIVNGDQRQLIVILATSLTAVVKKLEFYNYVSSSNLHTHTHV